MRASRKRYKEKHWEELKRKEKERRYKKHIWQKHRFTMEDWQTIYDTQKGCCAICGKHQSILTRRLYLDHCHETNVVRGLLCPQCNTQLGWYETKKNIIDQFILRGNR